MFNVMMSIPRPAKRFQSSKFLAIRGEYSDSFCTPLAHNLGLTSSAIACFCSSGWLWRELDHWKHIATVQLLLKKKQWQAGEDLRWDQKSDPKPGIKLALEVFACNFYCSNGCLALRLQLCCWIQVIHSPRMLQLRLPMRSRFWQRTGA